MVDRLALLNLAFTKAETAAEAMKLAKEMEAFILAEQQQDTPVGTRREWKSADIKKLVNMQLAGASVEEMCAALDRTRMGIVSALNRLKNGEPVGRTGKPKGRPRKDKQA